MPFGRLNVYASYADIECMERKQKSLSLLVLGLVIGLVIAKFLGSAISSAY